MTDKAQNQDILSPAEVAKLLYVTPATVRLWAEKGELTALTTPGGHRRFVRENVEAFAKSKDFPINSLNEKKLRILIVDDEKQYSRYLLKLFGMYSDKVIAEVANDGFEAGIAITEFKPDVVILDLMMDGIDGFQVCHRIKSSKKTNNIRVIAMTGHPSAENINNIIEAGAETCMPKPIDKDALLAYLDIEHSTVSAHIEE